MVLIADVSLPFFFLLKMASPYICKNMGEGKDIRVTVEVEGERESETDLEVSKFAKFLGWFGLQVARCPIFVIILMIILTCLASIGFVRIQIISDGIKLWVPQESKAMFDRKAVTKMFDTHKNFMYINIKPVEERQGILYTEAFTESVDLHDIISTSVVESRVKSYKDLCLKTSWLEKCYFSGSKYLDLWNKNLTMFHGDIHQELKNEFLVVVDEADSNNALTLSNMKSCGGPYQAGRIIDGEEKQVIDCEVLKLGYAIDDSVEAVYIEQWFAAAEAAVADFNKHAVHTRAYIWHRLSLDQAIQKTVIGDLHLMVTCFLLMVLTSITMLVKFKSDPSRHFLLRYCVDWKSSRVLLGCVAVLSVALSIAGGYGIAVGVCGVEFNTLCAILPFILVGIGVDDAFVLVSGLDRASAQLTYEPEQRKTYKEIAQERIQQTMATVGPTVTATSLTNIIAFLLGSITAIPALRSFCIYAGICILCDYIMQVTFFLSVMTLFEYQQVKRMMSEKGHDARNQADIARGKGGDARTIDEETAKVSNKITIFSMFDLLSWILSKTLSPLCTKKIQFRLLVIASSMAFAALSVYGVMNIQQGLPLKDLTTMGSNLHSYFELEESSFENQVGPETALYFIEETDCSQNDDIDISTPLYQQKLLRTHRHIMTNSKHIIFKRQTWLEELIMFAQQNASNLTVDVDGEPFIQKEHFYPVLKDFLSSSVYSDFSNDVHFAKSRCSGELEVVSSRFHYSHAPTGKDYGMRKKALREIRSLETECKQMFWKETKGAKIFLYGLEYLFWEQDAVLLKECLLSLGLAVAGVFIVSFVIIGFHLTPILVIVSAIILVDLYLFGFLYILGLRFNAVSER